MRLLAVTAQLHWPPRSGGAIVGHQHLSHLSGRHEVHLLALGAPRPLGGLEGRLARLEFVAAPALTPLGRHGRTALALLRGVPPSVSAFAAPALSRRVAAAWAEGRWDAMVLFEMGAVQHCPAAALPRVVANVEDPQAIRFGRMRRLEVWSPWQRLKLAVLEASSRRYEGGLLGRLGRVLVLSPADAAALRRQCRADVGVVPYGVELAPPGAVPDRRGRDAGIIVFSGNMFHPPNVDAALHFLRVHLPLVLREVPEARVRLVGADPDPRLRVAAARFGERVEITGRVDDVAAHLRRAMVSVCPVRLEIGVQTKVLEAMAWGTPVVTSSAGNAGVGARPGEEAHVEDAPGAFAARVAALLRGEGWERLSLAGQRLVAERFTWEGSGRALERHLEEVAARPGGALL